MGVRVGLIIPSSNTVMEVDFYRRLPPAATLHTARMYMEETTPEGESAMLDAYLPTAISDLRSARPDVMVFGCTSAGALRGNQYEAALIERIAAETGARTFSVASCVRSAIRATGARRVGVITPYVDSLNDKIRESLEADGLDVAAIHGLAITENFAIADVGPERIGAVRRRVLRRPRDRFAVRFLHQLPSHRRAGGDPVRAGRSRRHEQPRRAAVGAR